jgi:hypothetical protein
MREIMLLKFSCVKTFGNISTFQGFEVRWLWLKIQVTLSEGNSRNIDLGNYSQTEKIASSKWKEIKSIQTSISRDSVK